MTKAVVVSWLIGAVCGALIVLVLQKNHTATQTSSASPPAEQATGSAVRPSTSEETR